jgi:D-xylose transport system permease protein
MTSSSEIRLSSESPGAPSGENKAARASKRAARGRVSAREFSMLLALALIWTFFGIAAPSFLSPRNLSNLAVELSITAVLSLGMLLVIVCGQIDLSIGSGVGLFGGLSAVLMFLHHWPAPAAMAVCFAIAVLLWAGMGALIVRQRIPAFILTLAGLLIFKGLHWMVISDATIPLTVGGAQNAMSRLTTWYLSGLPSYLLAAVVLAGVAVAALVGRRRRQVFSLDVEPGDVLFSRLFVIGQFLLIFVIVCNQYRGIPLSALLLGAIALVVEVLLKHTRFGRYLYAVGGNEEAAIISGIDVSRVIIGAFAIMGAVVAIGGFLQTAYAGASTTTIGQLLELDAIAACVIGGASLKGGRGTVMGVLAGSLIMASLLNGLILMAVSPETKFIARGVVLALAVWMDVRLAARAPG